MTAMLSLGYNVILIFRVYSRVKLQTPNCETKPFKYSYFFFIFVSMALSSIRIKGDLLT